MDSAIPFALGIGRAMAKHVRKRCGEEGAEAALERRQPAGHRKARILDGGRRRS